MEELFKKFINENPHLLPFTPAGRPKGAVNKPKEIEVSKEDMSNVVLNSKQIKEIAKAKRAPRKPQTEEAKILMLENLARGREKAKLNREEKKAKPVEVKPVVKDTVTVVVPKKKPRKLKVVIPSDNEEDDTESITETTDIETKKIRKRVDRKTKILEQINKSLEVVQPTVQMTPFERLLMSRM